MKQKHLVRVCQRQFSQKGKNADFNVAHTKASPDAVSLAGALRLLSPSKDIKKSTPYKPSLFRSLQKGSASEEYASLKNEAPFSYRTSENNHHNSIASLMADLRSATAQMSWKSPQNSGFSPDWDSMKTLKSHVKSLRSEAELLDLLQVAYSDKKLSLSLLMQFLLNRNLRTLAGLPFNISGINRAEFVNHGWTTINFTELKILLLKKYHDVEQPLEIVKMLKQNFSGEFLPLIQAQQISPFYERIVWKFYFEYIGLGEELETITMLDSLRSSFLIWEATSAKSHEILHKISSQHTLNEPQALFLRVAMCAPVQRKIANELATERSPLLSALKRVSTKFQVYKAVAADDVASRAYAFSLIHKLEDLLATHFASSEDPSEKDELALLLGELKEKRTSMIKPEIVQHDSDCAAQYAH